MHRGSRRKSFDPGWAADEIVQQLFPSLAARKRNALLRQLSTGPMIGQITNSANQQPISEREHRY